MISTTGMIANIRPRYRMFISQNTLHSLSDVIWGYIMAVSGCEDKAINDFDSRDFSEWASQKIHGERRSIGWADLISEYATERKEDPFEAFFSFLDLYLQQR